MGGPWEDYQQSDGPWDDYKPSLITPTVPKRSFAQNLASDYSDAVIQGPTAMLAKLPETAHKIASRGGDILEQQISEAGYPGVGRAVNIATSYSPDVMSFAATPMTPAGTAVKSAVPLARRALGYTKRFLSIPESRRAANQAGEVALEQGIIPWTGSPETMLARAEKLGKSSGAKLGQQRESAGPKPVDRILEGLESLRASSPSKNSVINQKIDRAKELFLGLLDSSSQNQRVIKTKLPQEVSADTAQQIIGTASKPTVYRNPATGLEEIVDTGLQRTVVGGKRTDPVLGAMANNADLPTELNTVVGGKRNNVMGIYAEPEKFSINTFEALKKELADSVNYLADNATQKGTKKTVANIERSIEQLLKESGVDMTAYKQQKRLYGASASMKKALMNELSAQEGNNLTSLGGNIVAAGQLAAGDTMKAAASLGLIEAAKRRGYGVSAKILNNRLRLGVATSLGLSKGKQVYSEQ